MESTNHIAETVQQQLQDQRLTSEPHDLEPRSTPPNSECSRCGGSGWVRVKHGPRTGVCRCECLKLRILESKVQALPERFRYASFESYMPRNDRETEALVQIRENAGGSFYIFGGYGRGKTHLAVAQYRVLVEGGQNCLFLSMAELIHEIRRAELESEYYCQVIDRVRYAESFHLFVDDLDKFKPTEFKAEGLFDLFNTLYSRKLSLTVTTNMSLRLLTESERLDPAIVRRIDDICQAVEL